MEEKKISNAVIKRLPRYMRYLSELKLEGVEHISSEELSGRMKVTASQIRQDLNNFGGFGQQGYAQPRTGQQGFGQQGAGYQQQPFRGVPTTQAAPVYDVSEQKSRVVAGVLGIIFGALGLHNFYLGNSSKATAQLLMTLFSCGALSFVSAIWGFVEGIMILTGGIDKDGRGIPLKD